MENKEIKKILINQDFYPKEPNEQYQIIHIYDNLGYSWDSTEYFAYYVIENKETKETSLIKIVFNNWKGERIKSIKQVLPFKKRIFLSYEDGIIPTVGEKGVGFYSNRDEGFAVKEGELKEYDSIYLGVKLFDVEPAYIIKNNNGKTSMIIPHNKSLNIPPKYDDLRRGARYSSNYEVIYTQADGKKGLYYYWQEKRAKYKDYQDRPFIQREVKRRMIPPIFDEVDHFLDDSIFLVNLAGKVGLMDAKTGKVVIPPVYDSITKRLELDEETQRPHITVKREEEEFEVMIRNGKAIKLEELEHTGESLKQIITNPKIYQKRKEN